MNIPVALLMVESCRIDERIEEVKNSDSEKEYINHVIGNLKHSKGEIEKAIEILLNYIHKN